jgi:FkbM family methyltransferase
MSRREIRLGRIWKKVVWTMRLALLGATPWSAIVLAYQSVAIPIRNRMGVERSAYSARVRKNGGACVLHFAGTYEELLVLTEVFLEEAYRLPKLVERYGVTRIIDAGANAGYVSAYYAMTYPDAVIHAYEPSSTVSSLLEKNIASLANVAMYREAVSAADGEIEFHQDSKKNIASSVFDRKTGAQSVSVPCVSLDTAITRIGGEVIVKMDIEGAEFDAIDACTKRDSILYLTGEAHGDIASRDNGDIASALSGSHSVHLAAVAHAKRAIFHAIRFGVPVNVTYVLPSLIVGGIERQFVRQMNAMDRRIITPSLVTLFEYPGRETLYASLTGMKVVRLDGNGLFSRFSKVLSLRKALIELQSDVVVSSMFSGNACAAVASKMLALPHVPREHNTYEEKGGFHHFIDRLIVRHSYRSVAVSKAVARFAAAAIGVSPAAYEVIGNGIDIVDMPEEARKQTCEDVRMRKGIGMDEDVFLNVARLKKAKNQFALIEAFAGFSKVHPDTRLLLVGDGNERPAIDEMIASRSLDASVLRLGHRDDVASLYMAANAFILPSFREGFPNVALEAMSYGVPVIMTEGIGGQEELVTDGIEGYLCKTDADSISQALERWQRSTDEQRRSMSDAAKQKAATYAITSVVGRYSDLFVAAALRGKSHTSNTMKSW